MQSSARKVHLPSIAAFQWREEELQTHYQHYLNFRELLSEEIPPEDTTWAELLTKVFALLEKLTFEELIGMSIYLCNIVLCHRDELVLLQDDSPEVVEHKIAASTDILDKVMLLMQTCLEADNPVALCFSIEVMELAASLQGFEETIPDILSICKLLSNPLLQSKCYSVILSRGTVGRQLVKEIMSSIAPNERAVWMLPLLNYPGFINWSMIPFLLMNLANKDVSPAVRHKSSLMLPLLGQHIWSDEITTEITRGFLSQEGDLGCYALTLVKGTETTLNVFVDLLKNESMDPKLKAVLCMYSREVLNLDNQPKVGFAIDPNLSADEWSFEEMTPVETSQTPSAQTGPRISLSLQLAESLLLKFLNSRPVSNTAIGLEELQPPPASSLHCFRLLASASSKASLRLKNKLLIALSQQLEHPDAKVRETALSSLGFFGEDCPAKEGTKVVQKILA